MQADPLKSLLFHRPPEGLCNLRETKFLELYEPWPLPSPSRKEFQWEETATQHVGQAMCESAGHWVWVSEWLLFFCKESGSGRWACLEQLTGDGPLEGSGPVLPLVVVCGNVDCLAGLFSPNKARVG